jgi:hypothetical protein
MAPADFVYNNARYLFATGALDWATATIEAMLVSSSYSPAVTDVHVSDIPSGAIITRDQILTGLGVTAAGACYGAIPTWDALSSIYEVVAVILYKNTGTDSTSPLIYYSSSGPGFPFAVEGLNYFVGYDTSAGGYFQV